MFRPLIKAFLRSIFGWLYQVRVRGHLEAITQNERTLIIANHESWLDGLLLGLFLPGDPVFVVYSGIVGRPFFRIALSLIDYLKVDTSSPMAIKKVVELVKAGRPVVIFPEGRLTTTGALMKVYDGTAFAALKSEATVIPVGMDGAGRSRFTRMSGNHPRKWFPRITLSVQAPTRITAPEGLLARERRRLAGESMRLIMQEMLFQSADKRTLFETLLDAADTYGHERAIMADVKQLSSPIKLDLNDFNWREKLMMKVGLGVLVNRMMSDYTYANLIKMSVGLGHLVAKHTREGETVGVFLPNMAVTLGALFGASAKGRVPAMLNYKAGVSGILDSCTAAAIRTVISSRAFVEKANLKGEAQALETAGVRVLYLEDLRASVSLGDKLAIVRALRAPQNVEVNKDPSRPAVVLFTSGTEGKPKGVVLSHAAIASNIAQVRAVFDFNTDDRALNALPIFHSFGLTGGTLLPLFSGIHLVLYATPLHYKIIPELAYDRNSTVLFGTSTFLGNYGKHANTYDFFRLRYVVAGAEKVTDAVRNQWFEKFGKRILEGYGATETAPVLAVNTPKAYRKGTVGQFLPGIEYKLVPVPGIEQGGALYVKGPNVMSGYYRYDHPGVLEPTHSDLGAGWYATGDVVKVEDGFVSIVDRVKRFAKIAGEMVSLSVVESIAERAALGQGQHAVSTQEDAKKGEALVLFTTHKTLVREALTAAAAELGANELNVPRKIVVLEALPLLGTGKTDYVALKALAKAA